MGRGTEATSGLNVLFVMLFQLALALLFLIIAYASYKKYKENPKITLLCCITASYRNFKY